MAKAVPIDIRGFKGLNLREPAGMIQDDELSICKNLNIGRAGELTKRTGMSLLHDATTLGNNEVRLLGNYITSSFSYLIAKAGTNKIYYSSDGAAYTEIGTDKGTNVEWAVQYADELYMPRNGDVVQKWDGTTLSDVASSPQGTFAVAYKERLFVVNTNGTNNSRVYFSGPGDFSDWPSTNFLDVQPGDGDFVVAFAVIHDLLIIFKTQSTWALYVQGTPENWVLRNINPEIGCVSRYTPREIEGFLFFVGARGIYKTDGNIFEDVSSSIEPIFRDRVVNLTTVNIDAAAWWEDRYIVLLHPDPSTYRYLVYHLRTGGWTEWEFANDIRPAYFVEINAAVPGKGLYAGTKAATGRVFRHGDSAFTDAGVSFSCEFETKDFDFTLPSLMKRGAWMMIDVDASAQSTWELHCDGELRDTVYANGASSRKANKTRGPGYFRTFKIKCKYSSNSDYTFYGMTLFMAAKRPVIKAQT